ncbi:MAG: ABC transporter substrate-binding protein [Elusimicrobiota bacterium]
MKKILLPVICALLLPACTPAYQGEQIEVWHWMTDRVSAFDQLAQQYEEETGIRVNFELYAPSSSYSERIRAAGQTQNLPDIFGVLGEKKDLSSFINAGHIADLTPVMQREDEDEQAWVDDFFEQAIAVNVFEEDNDYDVKPGIYGVPIDIMNIPMIYNKDVLENAGLNPQRPPETWDEYIEYGKKIKDNTGVNIFASGFGETWLIESFAYNYAFNIMGQEKVMDTFRGNVSYTDPQWLQVFEIFEDVREHDLITDDSVTMQNRLAEQAFANERVAFTFNGSWCVNVYKGMNPDLNYKPMLPPRYSDEHEMVVWGAAGSSFLVNERSELKDEAVEFLKWISEEQQQVFLAEETLNLPSNRHTLDTIENEVLVEFSKIMNNATHPNIWPVTENTQVREAMNRGIQNIIIGERTAREVAENVQRIKNNVE